MTDLVSAAKRYKLIDQIDNQRELTEPNAYSKDVLYKSKSLVIQYNAKTNHKQILEFFRLTYSLFLDLNKEIFNVFEVFKCLNIIFKEA